MGGDLLQALKISIDDPPYLTRTEQVKVAAAELVLRGPACLPVKPLARLVSSQAKHPPPSLDHHPTLPEPNDVRARQVCRILTMVKDGDIDGTVGALSLDECDVLMKFIYRGVRRPPCDRRVAATRPPYDRHADEAERVTAPCPPRHSSRSPRRSRASTRRCSSGTRRC